MLFAFRIVNFDFLNQKCVLLLFSNGQMAIYFISFISFFQSQNIFMTKEQQENNNKKQDEEKPILTSHILPEDLNQNGEGVQVQVGLAKFKEKFSLKKNRALIDKRKENIFKADDWFIGTSYYRQQWSQLFPFIQEATCISIIVQFDLCPDILLDFTKPRFIYLKQLSLTSNTIKSIQAVNFIDAKCLQKLNLQGNQITTTKALNKTMFSKLQLLDLSKNFIQQININTFKTYNHNFSFEFLVHQRNREIQNISFFAKIQRKKFTVGLKSTLNSFSGVKPSHAVVQKQLVKSLKRKFIE